MTSWIVLIFTTLGGGAVGSIITAYGMQSRDLRLARATVRDLHARAEQIALDKDSSDSHTLAALAAVEAAAFTAAVPWYVVSLYRDARLLAHRLDPGKPQSADHPVYSPRGISSYSARQASTLLARVLWHPWVTIPSRRLRAWKIRRVLDGALPGHVRSWPDPYRASRPRERAIRSYRRREAKEGRKQMRIRRCNRAQAVAGQTRDRLRVPGGPASRLAEAARSALAAPR